MKKERARLQNPRNPTGRRRQNRAQIQARSATSSNKHASPAKKYPNPKERATKSIRKTRSSSPPIQFRDSNTNKKKGKKQTRWKAEIAIRNPKSVAERLGKIVKKWWRLRKKKRVVRGCWWLWARIWFWWRPVSPDGWWVSVWNCWCLACAFGLPSPGLVFYWRPLWSQPSFDPKSKVTGLKRSDKQTNTRSSETEWRFEQITRFNLPFSLCRMSLLFFLPNSSALVWVVLSPTNALFFSEEKNHLETNGLILVYVPSFMLEWIYNWYKEPICELRKEFRIQWIRNIKLGPFDIDLLMQEGDQNMKIVDMNLYNNPPRSDWNNRKLMRSEPSEKEKIPQLNPCANPATDSADLNKGKERKQLMKMDKTKEKNKMNLLSFFLFVCLTVEYDMLINRMLVENWIMKFEPYSCLICKLIRSVFAPVGWLCLIFIAECRDSN